VLFLSLCVPFCAVCVGIWQVASSLRARLETYHAVTRLHLADYEDALATAQARNPQLREIDYLRATAAGAHGRAAPLVPTEESAEAKEAREAKELAELKQAVMYIDRDDIAGRHEQRVEATQRWVDKRKAARKAELEQERSGEGDAAAAAAAGAPAPATAAAAASSPSSSSASAEPHSSVESVEMDEVPEFPSVPTALHNKLWKILAKYHGFEDDGYDS
jgi:hypothetical protein